MKPKQQGKLLSAQKIQDLIRLQELGYSQSRIARHCNVARSTVQDYLEKAQKIGLTFEDIENLSESELYKNFGKSKTRENFFFENIDFEYVQQDLTSKENTLTTIWQQGITDNKWETSYANFCRRYNKWCAEHGLNTYHRYHRDKRSQENQ